MKEKEFGKLSAQQVREFYEIFRKFINDFEEQMDDENPLKIVTENTSLTWHSLFELELSKVTLKCIDIYNRMSLS